MFKLRMSNACCRSAAAALFFGPGTGVTTVGPTGSSGKKGLPRNVEAEKARAVGRHKRNLVVPTPERRREAIFERQNRMLGKEFNWQQEKTLILKNFSLFFTYTEVIERLIWYLIALTAAATWPNQSERASPRWACLNRKVHAGDDVMSYRDRSLP